MAVDFYLKSPELVQICLILDEIVCNEEALTGKSCDGDFGVLLVIEVEVCETSAAACLSVLGNA